MKTIATSWDDGLQSDKRLLTFLAQYGIRASFGLTPGRYMKQPFPNDCRDEQKYGMLITRDNMIRYRDHDICNHTYYHIEMTADSDVCRADILAGKDELEDYFGFAVPGIIWPYGVSNHECREMAREIGHTFGRTTPAPYRFWGENFYTNWDIVPIHWDTTATEVLALPHKYIAIYGHTYELIDEYAWERLEALYLELMADPGCNLTTLTNLSKEIEKHEPAGRLQL